MSDDEIMNTTLSAMGNSADYECSEDTNEIQNSILIGDHEFFGPYTTTVEILPQPGILALLIDEENGFELIELLESKDLRMTSEIELNSYSENLSNIAIAVFYAAGSTIEELTQLKEKILNDFDLSEDEN